MKLCEALLGQDGMGYHPSSSFQANQPTTYIFDLCRLQDPALYTPAMTASMQARTKYLDPESINSYQLQTIYNWDITTGTSFYPPATGNGKFNPAYPNAVIGDMFFRTDIKSTRCAERAGKKAGMPVLYYKAEPSKLANDINTVPDPAKANENVYNFDDNYAITSLGFPWEQKHSSDHDMSKTPFAQPGEPGILRFYREILNTKVTSTAKPHNEDGYILMSAGWDGEYGTADDVFNFSE
jgi:hypothetical protein